MAEIRLLDAETVSQIAAGEVIERPASIVKELVENAIDAGATKIRVEIRDGGTSLIRVSDNGCGIAKDQIRTAFLRHSTSKIRKSDDLSHIETLGFRGEALASMAAVARVEVLTRAREEETGVRYVIEDGSEVQYQETACAGGSVFTVTRLFFNVPVRRKFLKSDAAEAAQVTDYVQRMVMGHPEIAFKLIRNGREATVSDGSSQLKNSFYAVYGREALSQMLEVDFVLDDGAAPVRVEGLASRPQQMRKTRTYENYYLNGRYIRSRMIERAIDNAYRDYVVPGTFPLVLLKIEMDPEFLDVNVHPSKMEVRFTREKDVQAAVYQALKKTLSQDNLTAEMAGPARLSPRASYDEPVQVEISDGPVSRYPEFPGIDANGVWIESLASVTADAPETVRTSDIKEPEPEYGMTDQRKTGPEGRPPFDQFRLVGQIFRTYWIAEYDETVYLIDQHAAHERVLYDRLKRRLASGNVDSQLLLVPLMIHLLPNEKMLVFKSRQAFERLGYRFEDFGDQAILIREVPSIFNGTLDEHDFKEMVDLLSEDADRVDQTVLIDRMAMRSCKAAIKGNDAISEMEMRDLLNQMARSENPFNCPHGRPTVLTMTKAQVEGRFLR